uniref:ras-related protein Rab-43-like n=1 Tax=Ciona intestinalis TaxID=7719 RepID=UPI00006A553B|nr:ras-related protein Rab-43-like [Ciona intestinalis]|eukprot:XP_002122173.1 ras-related protein Rab-43-like [Ciona intestinalis]
MNKEDNENYDFLFKIILIGDPGVGKTCIVQRFKSGLWLESQSSTIGVDFCMKSCHVDGKIVKLQIWDTAGQERFRTITQTYYRSANGVLCAFDITSESSFYNLTQWMEDVSKYCAGDVLKLLIGNKSDKSSERVVDAEEASNAASNWGALDYVETSAKDNSNVDKAFTKIATELLHKHSNPHLAQGELAARSGFNLDGNGRTVPVRRGCC